jgi:hypothetical protein
MGHYPLDDSMQALASLPMQQCKRRIKTASFEGGPWFTLYFQKIANRAG